MSDSDKLRILSEANEVGTYEDFSYWLSRFMLHFTVKNPERDAVIIGDLAGDFVEHDFWLVAVCLALDELRAEAKVDSPFMPPSGEIFDRVKRKHNLLSRALEAQFARNALTGPWMLPMSWGLAAESLSLQKPQIKAIAASFVSFMGERIGFATKDDWMRFAEKQKENAE